MKFEVHPILEVEGFQHNAETVRRVLMEFLENVEYESNDGVIITVKFKELSQPVHEVER
jgi:hypothetical protein